MTFCLVDSIPEVLDAAFDEVPSTPRAPLAEAL
jgi:hypothetical protein